MEGVRRPTAAETNLHSEGAEFLVLGNLLIRGVHATKAYTRYPGWDVLATNPETGQTCRVQVKARLATDFDCVFPIKNFDAEFVVLAVLNRGSPLRRVAATETRTTPASGPGLLRAPDADDRDGVHRCADVGHVEQGVSAGRRFLAGSCTATRGT